MSGHPIHAAEAVYLLMKIHLLLFSVTSPVTVEAVGIGPEAVSPVGIGPEATGKVALSY